MCTATWQFQEQGYDLFFNRDEKKTREKAMPPSLQIREGVRYLAPRDGTAQGTWLLVNEFGLTLGLLNFYEKEGKIADKPYQSRGQLALQLATCRDGSEVDDYLSHNHMRIYRPFKLLAISREKVVHLWEFNGQTLKRCENEPRMPVYSSSFQPEQVIPARQKVFEERGGDTLEHLKKFHYSGVDNPSAYTVMMCREDAQTWSVSHIHVGDTIYFHYTAFALNFVGVSEKNCVSID